MTTSRLNPDLKGKKREAVTRVILEATEEIWTTDGYAAISMATIAKKIGIAVGTIYNYFRSKENLIEKLVSSRLADLIDCALQEVEQQGKAPLERKLEVFFSSLYDGTPAALPVRKFLLLVHKSDPTYFATRSFYLETHLCEVLVPWVKKLRADGHIQSGDPFLASFLLITMAKNFYGLYRQGKVDLPTAKAFVKTSCLRCLGA